MIVAALDWFVLTRYGAWAPPDFDIVESMVDLANLTPYDEYSVELALSMFEASECAWYAQCNVLGRLSEQEARRSVESIERPTPVRRAVGLEPDIWDCRGITDVSPS